MTTADNERKLSDTVSQGANALLDEAAALILRHAPRTGVHATIVPGLTLYRITSNTFIERSAGELMTSFIVRGRKSTAIGGQVLEYGPGESLVCGIASPSEFHTLDASPENPFLALSVSLDMTVLMEYAGALAWSHKVPKSSDLPNGVHVIRPDEDLAEGFLLLLRLLERPALVSLRAISTPCFSTLPAALRSARSPARERKATPFSTP